MTFVRVRGGSVNLNSVVRYQNDSKDGDKAVLKDGTTVETTRAFFDAVVSAVVPQGDWECVIADAWDDDRLSHIIEPVLVWGFTVDRQIIPITPFYPAGVTDPYAIRRAGSGTVYSGDGSYSTAAEWLDMETRRARRFGEGPVQSAQANE